MAESMKRSGQKYTKVKFFCIPLAFRFCCCQSEFLNILLFKLYSIIYLLFEFYLITYLFPLAGWGQKKSLLTLHCWFEVHNRPFDRQSPQLPLTLVCGEIWLTLSIKLNNLTEKFINLLCVCIWAFQQQCHMWALRLLGRLPALIWGFSRCIVSQRNVCHSTKTLKVQIR